MYISQYNNINFESVAGYIPVFSNKLTYYYRNEKNGYISLKTKLSPFLSELLINETSSNIIKLCDGTHTIGKLFNDILKIYDINDSDTIKKDIIKILFEYSKVGLIYWKGENPFMKKYSINFDEGYSIVLAQEYDIKMIYNFFKENFVSNDYIKYFNPTIEKKEYLSQMAYREKLFSYSEEFILLKKNNNIEGIISIKLPVKNQIMCNSSVGVFGSIILKKEILKNNIRLAEELVQFSKKVIKEESVCEITKIRYVSLNNSNLTEDLTIENMLKKLDFNIETILLSEFNSYDIKFLEFIY